MLAEANQLGTPLTILCFNIAGLRTVNESFGYQAGDGVLAEAARRLREAIAEDGMLSRIAGDEFICLLNEQTREQAMHLGQKAQEQVGLAKLKVRPDQYAH